MEAIDCQSFAGGFTLGMQRAGLDVIAKRENIGGFGTPLVEGNADRHFPAMRELQESLPEQWIPMKVPVVFGNPPCSGFSGYTTINNMLAAGHATGVDHPINQCMRDIVQYAAECRAQVMVMESVTLAFSKGRDLMLDLRDLMELETGRRYDLIHVKHSSASIGGSTLRKRYFLVLARRGMNFGVNPVENPVIETMSEMLSDLETQPLTWEAKRYRRKARTELQGRARANSHSVDGHELSRTIEIANICWLAEHVEWKPGEFIGDVMRRAISELGIKAIPDHAKYPGTQEVKRSLLTCDAYASRRWHANKIPGVVTGTATIDVVHPVVPRAITFRESARIMGFPDDWSLAPIGAAPGRRVKYLGKGITVQCGEWIGAAVKDCVNGEPQAYRGSSIGDREWLIDVSLDYKKVYDDRTGEKRDSRSKKLKREMEARTW